MLRSSSHFLTDRESLMNHTTPGQPTPNDPHDPSKPHQPGDPVDPSQKPK